MSTDAPTRRWTAEERRRVVVEAAIAEFAEGGLAGASTEAIAARAGISHAYLFRLFGTRRRLFLAAAERSFARVHEVFREAARQHRPRRGAPIQAALGAAYRQLLEDRKELMFHFHVYAAACSDEEVREVARRRWRELLAWWQREAGLSADEARLFAAQGMLLNVATALELPQLAQGDWLRRVTEAIAADR